MIIIELVVGQFPIIFENNLVLLISIININCKGFWGVRGIRDARGVRGLKDVKGRRIGCWKVLSG